MGIYSWLSEVPPGTMLIETPQTDQIAAGRSGAHGVVVIESDVLEAIDEYATSVPTSPSAGRIYRRLGRDPDGVCDQPYVYLVVDAPDGDGQLHVPHRALVL